MCCIVLQDFTEHPMMHTIDLTNLRVAGIIIAFVIIVGQPAVTRKHHAQ